MVFGFGLLFFFGFGFCLFFWVLVFGFGFAGLGFRLVGRALQWRGMIRGMFHAGRFPAPSFGGLYLVFLVCVTS